jgi:signal peptidase II
MQHRLWFVAVALVAAALDLWTKSTAFANNPDATDIPVIPGLFSFGKTTNPGIVFGLFATAGPVFLVVSVLAVPAILFIFLSIKKPRWVLTAALALILGGTLGNMYDRLMWGEVRDFIKFYWGQKVWPLFNLADSCICVGVFLLTLEMLFFDDKKKARAEDPAFSTERIAVGDTEPMPRAEVRSLEPDYEGRPGPTLPAAPPPPPSLGIAYEEPPPPPGPSDSTDASDPQSHS